jgi:Zn-finger nucleic acid-binding protein
VNRDEFLECPRCQRALEVAGDRVKCAGCKGQLVTEPELQQLIAGMLTKLNQDLRAPAPLPFEPCEPRADDAAVTCPRCATVMTRRTLYTMAVDRCPEHGVWFDGTELERALTKAAEPTWKATLGQKIAGTVGVALFIAAELAAFLLAH